MKKLSAFVLAVIVLCFSVMGITASAKSPRLSDGADLLKPYEEKELLSLINRISEEYQYDIVIITVDSLGNKDVDEYAADAYLAGNYGYGESNSGVLFLVSMEYRDWYLHFEGADILPSADYMSDYFLDYLSEGYYFEAFESFAEEAEDYIHYSEWDVEKESEFPGTVNYKEPFGFFGKLIFWAIIGFIVAFIATGIMKGKLKSVEKQTYARQYLRKNSFRLKTNRDSFLYSNVRRVARPKNTSSGSGSRSSSGGSSGRSYRGGGGKF